MSQRIPQQSMNQEGGPGSAIKDSEINQENYMRLPPNLIRIRADDNGKKIMLAFWIILISIFVFMAFLMLAIPDQIIPKSNRTQLAGTSLQNCTNPQSINQDKTFNCANFSNNNPNIGNLNQFFLLFLQVTLKNESAPFAIKSTVVIEQYALSTQNQNNIERLVYGSKIHEVNSYIDMDDQSSSKVSRIEEDRRDRPNDSSSQATVYRKFIAYQYDTDTYQNELIFIKFLLPQPTVNVEKMELVALTINPQFTLFTILIRYFFFIGSAISGVIFFLRYKDIPYEHRTIEQRLVLVQSILLLFFNDPLYAATVLKPNGFLTFYSVFVVVNFVIFIIFTWIIFIERILYENGKKQTELLNWKKIVYAGIIYVLSIVLLCLVAFYHIEDQPIIPEYDIATGQFLVLQIITLVVILLGFLYIFVQYFRSCHQLSTKLWRNQLYMVFVILFMVMCIAIIAFDGFHIFNLVGRRILLIFTVMNVYTYYLQYMYSVTQLEIQRIQSGQSYVDDRKQVKSIMSDMNYGEIQLDMQSNDGLPQQLLNNAGLKHQYLTKQQNQTKNGDNKLLANKQNEENNKNNFDAFELED